MEERGEYKAVAWLGDDLRGEKSPRPSLTPILCGRQRHTGTCALCMWNCTNIRIRVVCICFYILLCVCTWDTYVRCKEHDPSQNAQHIIHTEKTSLCVTHHIPPEGGKYTLHSLPIVYQYILIFYCQTRIVAFFFSHVRTLIPFSIWNLFFFFFLLILNII